MTAPETYFTSTLPEAFDRAGLPYPGPADPGKILRFSTDERDRTDRAGWLSMLPDGTAAAFGCWRSGDSFTWQHRDTNDNPPSQDEREKARQRCEKARIQAERERVEAYTSAAAQAAAKRASYQPAPRDHPYLAKKGIAPHSARIDPDGRLVVAIYGEDGTIQSLQSIAADGSKRFMTGGKVQGGFCLFGSVRADGPILLAEGWATAATLHEATGLPTYAAFSASNIHHVAKMLEARYPTAQRVICGDDDVGREDNPGRKAAQAAAAATGALVIFPAVQPGGSDFNDMAKESGMERVRDLVQLALEPKAAPPRFTLLTPADLAAEIASPALVKGLIPQAGIGSIFSPSGGGKTFLLLDLFGALATRPSWFGFKVSAPCKSTYVALEGDAGIKTRVAALTAEYGDLTDTLRIIKTSLDIRLSADRAALAAAIIAEGFGGGVCALDTLNRAAPGIDENSSRDMGEVIAAIKALQAEIGGVVIAVHHSGKDKLKGLRGHSSLHAALDFAIEVNQTDDRREWVAAKVKDGDAGKVHPFSLKVVPLGEDADGDPITSCVVQIEQDTQDASRPHLPQGGNQRIVWDGLGELLRASTTFGEAGSPPSRPCVRLDEAINSLRSRIAAEPKRQVERTRRAINDLIGKRLLTHRDGWLWTP